ncbi:MAG TPA: pyridoxamine 5'-phosphate oxidase family protein [Candidatus Saccharimonadales bacterium]|nr:pyridoxamine 5'-phosphate oxidase family protein [Candidatus Saccharimonadales bacterium]
MDDMPVKIARAKDLLATVNHAAMATVNADGSPHNTPYFFMRDETLEHLYWGSHPDSEHSKNVVRTGQIFVVLYDAVERGGLYIRADDAHIAEGDELVQALHYHNERRVRQNKKPLLIDYYETQSPQRMWVATARQFWVNDTERNKDGQMVRDLRIEITRGQLLH